MNEKTVSSASLTSTSVDNNSFLSIPTTLKFTNDGYGSKEIYYPNINPKYEYLDLSWKHLHIEGILQALETLESDELIKHINLSNNINADETESPSKMRKLLTQLGSLLKRNRNLRALDFAGNHLFLNSIHPGNEHLTNYTMDFIGIMMASRITHLDISDNDITGPSGRMLKGFTHLMKTYVLKKATAFTCRYSKLHSQAFLSVGQGLGVFSNLIYLDLSDNFGGLDPTGHPNSEGIEVFSKSLAATLKLKVVKLARNCLGDDEIGFISKAVQFMPYCQVLDLSGNQCHGVGMESLKEAILSHSNLDGDDQGLTDLDLSGNPLGWEGSIALRDAIKESFTLLILKINKVEFDEACMTHLTQALKVNHLIYDLDISRNHIKPNIEKRVLADIRANQYLLQLMKNTKAATKFNANELINMDKHALSRKLQHLPITTLEILLTNASFNIPLTELQISLHLACPPSRKHNIKVLSSLQNNVSKRAKESAKVIYKANAVLKVYKAIMKWWKAISIRKNAERILREAEMKRKDADARIGDEDRPYG